MADLETASLEGPTISALYTAESRPSGVRPPPRTAGWRIGLEYEEGAGLTEVLSADRARGLETAWMRRSPEVRVGLVDEAPAVDWATVAKTLGAGASVTVDAGASVREVLGAWPEPNDTDASLAGVVFDPLTTMAVYGGLGCKLAEAYSTLAEVTLAISSQRPSARTILVDAVPLHDAGASAEQEVAYTVATGLEHLRQLERHGLSPAAAMPYVLLRLSVGTDLLVDIAKLRAVHRLWSRIRAHLRADKGRPTLLWVNTSWRSSTQRDPWVNLLRGTVGGISAILGGASGISVLPFTQASGMPSAEARRLAINTQHILRGEAHLSAVDDPTGGSFAIESLTDALAQGAWSIARGWLGQGGMAQCLLYGIVQAEVGERAADRAQSLATGQSASLGTSLYPHLDEDRPSVEPGGPPEAPDDDDFLVRAPVLERRRVAEPFEALRERSDAVVSALGQRPSAVLVVVGDARRARASLDFARNWLAVGGWDSQVAAVDALPESPRLCVVCGSPSDLVEQGASAIKAADAAGARVLVAGPATDALRKAGAHDFIHQGADLLTLLGTLQTELFPSSSKADA